MTSVLAAFLLLGICIFFHELGHFLMGKLVGVTPKIFSIGYGKGIWYKKFGKTIYQITAIPLGGYVQFYGDNLLKKYKRFKKGDFLGAHPLKRIAIAFGGPGFSILLGYLVIFILVASGWQPTSNKIMMTQDHPGLQTGDTIISINGEKTDSFEDIAYHIALSPTLDTTLEILRNGKSSRIVTNVMGSDGPRYIPGLRPYGKRFLTISDTDTEKKSVFRADDKILKVNNKPVSSLPDLKKILDKHKEKTIEVTLERKTGSILNPSQTRVQTIQAPVYRKEMLVLSNLEDAQTKVKLAERKIGIWQKDMWQTIRLETESFSQWEEMKKNLPAGKRQFYIGSVLVSGDVSYTQSNLLMISIQPVIDAEKATHPTDFLSMITRSFDQTVFITKATLVGIYRIFQGKLSFEKSISGPIKIMAIAAKTVDTGWEHYWLLLAQITIVLGIMNLLPIPVLDGGHIIFYTIEWIYKPLSPQIIAGSIRTGMILLMVLGVYVIGLDIWDVFVRGVLY